MRPRAAGIIAACLIAGACGFWLARSGASALATADLSDRADRVGETSSNPGKTTRNARLEKTSTARTRSPAQFAGLKNEIMRNFANSASPAHDWTLRAQTAALLSTLSDPEFEDFISALVPENGPISSEDWQHTLLIQIYQAWGLKNPAAACGFMPAGWMFGQSVFDDWLKRDPEAAAALFEKSRSSGKMDPLVQSMQRSLLNQQALSDLQGASRSLDDVDPQMKQSMLITWTRIFANDPAKRQELAALLASWPDAKVAEAALRSLIQEFSGRSPSDAAAFVETLEVAESLKDQLSHELIGEWALTDPEKAFGAWIERGETQVPAPLMRAMDAWSLNFPGVTESIKWVNGLQPGPVKEQFKTHMIGYLAELERFPESAQLSTGIADPTERVRQMNQVKRIWEERYPKQANEWFSKLPPEDQAAMEKPLE